MFFVGCVQDFGTKGTKEEYSSVKNEEIRGS